MYNQIFVKEIVLISFIFDDQNSSLLETVVLIKNSTNICSNI